MTKRRHQDADSRRPLALVSVLVAAATLSPAAAAAASVPVGDAQSGTTAVQLLDTAPVTFVSNHGQQDPDGFLLYGGGSVFQGFTTGGNPGGYSLSEVSVIPQQRTPDPEEVTEMSDTGTGSQLQLAGIATDAEPEPLVPQPSVEIWSQKGRNITMPDDLLYRLISPPSVPLDESVTFQAPSDTVLDPNTSYYVRITNAIQVGWDMDRHVDNGTADDWSVINGLMYQSEGANAWANFVPNAIVSISGVALAEPVE